jgi:hypothetical protein
LLLLVKILVFQQFLVKKLSIFRQDFVVVGQNFSISAISSQKPSKLNQVFANIGQKSTIFVLFLSFLNQKPMIFTDFKNFN